MLDCSLKILSTKAKTCFLFAIYNERFFRLNAVAMLNEVIFYYDL